MFVVPPQPKPFTFVADDPQFDENRQSKSSEFGTHSTYQPRRLWVIDHFGNRPISNALNRFVNHLERH